MNSMVSPEMNISGKEFVSACLVNLNSVIVYPTKLKVRSVDCTIIEILGFKY